MGVLSLKTGGKRLHVNKKGDTQAAINSNSSNKTGDLDIFWVRLSRRKPGFNSPWGYHKIIKGLRVFRSPFCRVTHLVIPPITTIRKA